MLLEKTLILKGVAGVATVGGVVGGGYFLKKSLERPLTKEEKLAEINKKLGDLGLGECNLVITDLTTPTVFSKDCDLDKTKLEKIKFSNKAENSNVTVTGLTEGGNIKLNIANKEGNDGAIKYTFKEIKTKLTISGDSTKPNINLKANEEREFEDKGGKLGKVSKNSDASKIKELNGKLGTIKIPAWCRFEEEDNETSLECDLSKQDELKKIEFYNKTNGKDLTIVGSTDNLKLTINRLEADDGSKKYQTGTDLEFFFSGYSQEIKIQGEETFNTHSDISLNTSFTTLFKISDQNKLAKYFNYSIIGQKLGLSCSGSSPITCTPVGASTTIKVLNSAGNDREEIKVEDSQKDTQILTVTENTANYELGIKFTGKTNFPATDSKIQANVDYEPKYVTGKGWALSKKST